MTWTLRLAFDRDDHQFVLGFEFGDLWRRLEENPGEVVEQLVHAENAVNLMRVGEASGRKWCAWDVDGTWINVSYAPVRVTA